MQACSMSGNKQWFHADADWLSASKTCSLAVCMQEAQLQAALASNSAAFTKIANVPIGMRVRNHCSRLVFCHIKHAFALAPRHAVQPTYHSQCTQIFSVPHVRQLLAQTVSTDESNLPLPTLIWAVTGAGYSIMTAIAHVCRCARAATRCHLCQ